MIVNWIHGLVSVWLDMKVGNISFDQIISFSQRLATIQTVSNVPTNREDRTVAKCVENGTDFTTGA